MQNIIITGASHGIGRAIAKKLSKKYHIINIDIDENSIIDNFKKLKKSSLKKYNDVSDILDKNVDSKYYLSEKIKRTILSDGTKNFKSKNRRG